MSPCPEVMFILLHLENYLCLFWGFIVTVKCILEIPNWIHMQVVLPFFICERGGYGFRGIWGELFLMFSTGIDFQNPSWTSKNLVCSHGLVHFFVHFDRGRSLAVELQMHEAKRKYLCIHMCTCKWVSMHSYTCKFDVCTCIYTFYLWLKVWQKTIYMALILHSSETEIINKLEILMLSCYHEDSSFQVTFFFCNHEKLSC